VARGVSPRGRGSSRLSTILNGGGIPPVLGAVPASLLDEADRGLRSCRAFSLQLVRWLSPVSYNAKSDGRDELAPFRPRASTTPNVSPPCSSTREGRAAFRTKRVGEAAVEPKVGRRPAPGASAREPITGDIVVLAAGPPRTSAKILLNSANDHHPKGLANGSDQVGPGTTCSTTAGARWWRCRKERDDTVFQKTLAINDFYFGGVPTYDWPIGQIQMVGSKSNGAPRCER